MEKNEHQAADDNADDPMSWVYWALAAGAGVLVLVAIIATPSIVRAVTRMEPKTAGEFGDMFGAVNALISGLAFLGVVVAILLQRQELGLQRKELKDTREVLSQQRTEMQMQNAALGKQQFESMFFQMISLHNQIVNDLDITEKRGVRRSFRRLSDVAFGGPVQNATQPAPEPAPVVVRGRDVFQVFHKQLNEAVRSGAGTTSEGKRGSVTEEVFGIAFDSFYRKHSADLGHYFRNLYTVVEYADEHGGEAAMTYVKIIRAQLSVYELVFLFYDCTCGFGTEDLRILVEKYALLEYLDQKLLIADEHCSWLSASAYYLDG
jgi:hypothetical protein